MTVAFCRAEQLRCAAEILNGNIHPGGAGLGLFDWFAEEFLMTEMKQFESGAKSTVQKPEYRLVPLEAMQAIAKRLAYGAARHGEKNYQKGAADPAFIRDRQNHAIEHLLHYANGDTITTADGKVETPMDHLEAAICNLAMLCWLEAHRTDPK
jgi:hypothetical protein